MSNSDQDKQENALFRLFKENGKGFITGILTILVPFGLAYYVVQKDKWDELDQRITVLINSMIYLDNVEPGLQPAYAAPRSERITFVRDYQSKNHTEIWIQLQKQIPLVSEDSELSPYNRAVAGHKSIGRQAHGVEHRVRLAMAHAYDRERVLRDVSYDLYLPSNGIFDTEHMGYNPDIELIEFDLERAAQLLDECGWAVSPDDGWRYKTIDGKPVRFDFVMIFPQTFVDAKRMANIYRADLAKIGVSFKSRTFENATYTARQIDHDFQASVGTNGFALDADYWRLFFR
ncbi:MAG: hypothetical protein IIA07_07775, partial [Proteobacteria bacterium]|nr:hypothetical protein [Pseudomonadota bacterium]